ncbi:hypothetical protein Tsubulata_043013 [Turnera subulata]|uniref:Uncharacterized protein n=1 Tax=Turnera subulata TaxID=218843 RepID=A0A9Q0JDW4_9ROSI|nr:hypothetical protein Tsubulata_043013 [Turnera subulata]
MDIINSSHRPFTYKPSSVEEDSFVRGLLFFTARKRRKWSSPSWEQCTTTTTWYHDGSFHGVARHYTNLHGKIRSDAEKQADIDRVIKPLLEAGVNPNVFTLKNLAANGVKSNYLLKHIRAISRFRGEDMDEVLSIGIRRGILSGLPKRMTLNNLMELCRYIKSAEFVVDESDDNRIRKKKLQDRDRVIIRVPQVGTPHAAAV